MSSHNNNNNNNNGQPPRRNRDGPSGADKGKGRALPRPPTPDASLGWGATEDPEPMEVLPTPTGLAPIKRKPPPKKGKKTRGQKRREREQREEDELHGWDSDDSNMKALAGEAVPHAREAQQLLAHRREDDDDDVTTIPGASTVTDAAPMSLRASPNPSFLQPPPREDHSSSASSQTSKRRREESPDRRRPAPHSSTYDQYVPSNAPRWRRSPPLPQRHWSPPPPSPPVEARIHHMERRLVEALDRIQELEDSSDLQWQRGYHQGRAEGFKNAISASARQDTPRRRDPDEQYVRDLRRATDDSRRMTRRAPSPPSSRHAGPSRAPERSRWEGPPSRRRSPPRRASPRPPLRRPPPGQSTSTRVEVPGARVIVTTSMGDWPDPRYATQRGLAHVPVPSTRMSGDLPNEVVIPETTPATHVAAATSYDELWQLFRLGTPVPEVFSRFFEAEGQTPSAEATRNAAMGYVHTRRIAEATNMDRHTLSALLVVLATYERFNPISTGLWHRVLRDSLTPPQHGGDEPMPPVDNWHHFRQFVAHHSSALPARGISFSPPENVAEPWTIRTNWTEGELMRMLLRVRPSERSLQELISYADLFVRTRHGNGPLAGIENAGVPVGRLFPAPFITAPSTLDAFLGESNTPPANDDIDAPMDVDPGPSPHASPHPDSLPPGP